MYSRNGVFRKLLGHVMNNNQIIEKLNSVSLRDDIQKIEVGDNIEISTKWFDNKGDSEKFKINIFKGVITSIVRKNSISSAFTVVKESPRIIIKKKFFFNSPLNISIKKIGRINKVRRAKLYYYERKLSDKKRRS